MKIDDIDLYRNALASKIRNEGHLYITLFDKRRKITPHGDKFKLSGGSGFLYDIDDIIKFISAGEVE